MTTGAPAAIYAGGVSAVYAWLRCHPKLVDGLLAAVLTFGGVASWGPGWLLHAPLALGMTVPIVFRRSYPVAAFGTAVAVGGVQVLTGLRAGASDLAVIVLLYTLAAYTPRRFSVPGLAICLLGALVASLRWITGPPGLLKELLSGGALLGGPVLIAWVLGDSMRYRRAYYASLEDRAARLEAERDAQAQIAAATERARIARELHDVVAHHVSVMVVQADGASYAMDAEPERARQALATIAGTGRRALAEMRRLLGVLRSDGDPAGLAPLPGVGQLSELLAQSRAAGLAVSFTVEGVPRPLPDGAALAAYRIVQESLTNTRKHGGLAATAQVTLRYWEESLRLTITDDGRGAAAASDGTGHGLAGMRERVALYGGSLTAGPRPGGGFAVTAVLPLVQAETNLAGAG
ncbi:MAG: sensor histidine kinase [Actinobacteria bacterium]|nr:sensor histidine kinase [Actinomycetota bacterium]